MRIVIAEDELLERKALVKFIEQNMKTMEVVGEAANGRKAIELAKQLQPDIIFMDIKMPGINGLEAIEQIYQFNPRIKFILLTAYDSFDYAKQAMRYGIKDYIVKPEKKEEVVQALLRLQQEIEQEREAEREKRQSEALMREHFMVKVMQEPVEDEAFHIQEKLYPNLVNCCFIVIKLEEEFANGEEKIQNHLDYPYLINQTEDGYVICLLAPNPLTKADLLTAARKIKLEFQDQAYVGIGEICETIKDLPNSYQQAYAASIQHKYEEKSNYGFLNDDYLRATDIIPSIVREIENGNSDKAILLFKMYEHMLQQASKEELYLQLKNVLAKRNMTVENTSLTSLQTSHDWVDFIEFCGLKIKGYFQSRHHTNQIKSYIEEHYHQPIKLEDVADAVNLSPSYFSNLFKKEFGETFSEYVTAFRMKKAKELIEENTYTLKEIAFMVGYKDPNYFSRVFKKYYNEAPTDFQRKIFK